MPSLHPKGRGGPKAFCTRGGFSPNPLALSYGEESTLHFVYDICHFLDISGYWSLITKPDDFHDNSWSLIPMSPCTILATSRKHTFAMFLSECQKSFAGVGATLLGLMVHRHLIAWQGCHLGLRMESHHSSLLHFVGGNPTISHCWIDGGSFETLYFCHSLRCLGSMGLWSFQYNCRNSRHGTVSS
jgi:hypothetical protein